MPFSSYSSNRSGSSKKGGFSAYAGKSSSAKKEEKDPIESLLKQIDNTKTRIQDSGFDPEEDKRNWFEKLTNLPEKQNAFFDVLELIGRPGKAALNAIDKGMEGQDPAIAAWKGFSGKDRITGAEFAREKLGVDTRAGQFIAGLGTDIVTDPLNLIPAKAVATGLSTVGKAVSKGVNKIPGVAKVKDVTEPLTTGVKDTLGKMFQYQYKWDETLDSARSDKLKSLSDQTDNNIQFMTENQMKKIVDTARTTGVEAGEQVGRIMESPLKQFDEASLSPEQIQQMKELDDEINGLIPQIRQTNQDVKGLQSFHRGQVELSRESNLLDQIKSLTNGKMIKTDGMEEIKLLPNWLKRKDGVPVDQLADELGYKYADDLVQELKGITSNRVKRSDVSQVARQRLERDEQYKNLISTKSGLDQTLDALKQGRKEIKPERVEIPRPQRELSSDPNIQEAAQKLTNENQMIRQWAQEQGVDVKEIEGYMTHVLATEERKMRKTGKPIQVDRGNFGIGQPNKKILKSRELKGSAEDVNDQTGRKFFEPNAYFATAIGQKRLIEYANAVNFRRQVLSDPRFAVKYEKGMILPKDAVIINTNNYKFMTDEAAQQMGLYDEIGGEYVVTKGVKEALDRYQKLTTDEGVKGFLKAFDATQTFWKKFALFSPGFHIRNDVGAKFNNWVAGMESLDIVKYTKESVEEVYKAVTGNESKLFNEYRQQGLSSSNLSKVEFKYNDEPEKEIERMINRASLEGMDKVVDKVKNPFETSREVGDFIDQINRFALYKWARDKKGMEPKQAAAKVREVQFDYTRNTTFEREIAVRVIPFYRWIRNNLPYQIRQFINNPKAYNRINNVRLNAQETVGIDDENVPDWMKQSFAIPWKGDGQGNGEFISLNLPLGDLAKLSDPGKMFVDSLSPLGKLPVELTMNRNFFYDKPIEKFEGQEKQFQIPLTDTEFGLPVKAAYAIEQATGQIGRGFSQYLQKPGQEDLDTEFRMPSLGISSLSKEFDVNQAKFYQLLEELRKLQDQMHYIEQQTGYKPRTVREINKN